MYRLMNTSERILFATLELMNREGPGVSIKEISDHLKISPGNLTYHFKHKEELIHTLFDKLFEEMDNLNTLSGSYGLQEIHDLFLEFYEFQERYKFFFLHIIDFVRDYPAISEEYQHVISIRTEDTKAMMYYLKGKGTVKNESVPGAFENLVHNIWMVNTFWLAQQRLFTGYDNVRYKSKTIELIWSLVVPYLTDEGIEELEEVIPILFKDENS